MVGQHLSDGRACLVLTAEVPECRHKNRLRSQPARFLGQDTEGNVSRSYKIAKVKPRPRLVDLRLIKTERAEPLRLFFILGGFSEIAGIAMNHSGYMAGV